MKANKHNITIVLAVLLFVAGCASPPPAKVTSSSVRSVHITSGEEPNAKAMATAECRKWGKSEAVLTNVIQGYAAPNYFYDCK